VVELANACRDIKVGDDGCGMAREDAELALVRHATSKITEFDDLWSLETRGFRGEALASIGAVSRLQILTRLRGEVAGTRVEAEGGSDPRIEAAGAPEGTEIRVRDLFFNTPARLKFMKSGAAELQQVLQMLTRQALIRPDIGFSVTNEKSLLIDLPPAQPWAERVAMLLGSGIMENLLEVDATRHTVRIRGFIVQPAITRKDRRQQFFFVNGRPVASRSLSFALQEAYRGVIMTQRFPVVVLDIIVPAGEVDINVHPTKEEVRFRNEAMVNGTVNRVVAERLRRANLLPMLDLGGDGGSAPGAQQELPGAFLPEPGAAATSIPVDFRIFTSGITAPGPTRPDAIRREVERVIDGSREFEAAAAGTASPAESAQGFSRDDSTCSVRPVQHSLRGVKDFEGDLVAGEVLFRGGNYPEPLGQVGLCYIIARTGNDMLLVDQHAAHERLLYLKFSGLRGAPPSQPLLIPVSVDVPVSAVPYMTRLLPVFESLGMKVEPFGGQTFMVQSVPADLSEMDPGSVISDMLDDVEALGRVGEVEVLRDRVVTRMACRSAIKAGQALHLEEMRALIREIARARLGFTCPHGRPTMILLTRDQLDRQFKRKL
jgi:DNA mismatch repair protein MutL